MQQEKVMIYHPNLRGNHPIRAVLFDMDGLVLDTEKLYSRFWREATAFYGFPMTYEQSLGLRSLNSKAGEEKLKSYFGDGIDFQKVHDKRIELMDVFVEKEGVERKLGVETLLEYLKANNIKTSIATSSPLERAKKYLDSVGLLEGFDEIVSGKMVKCGKPEPDIYLYAAENLGVKPEECMILEDSPTGIVAGYRAGCIPVMVPDQSRADEETKKMLYAEVDGLEHVIELLENCIQMDNITPEYLTDKGICPTCYNRSHNYCFTGDETDKTIYENELFKCILVNEPRAEGHTVIVSQEHYKDMMDIPDDLCKEMYVFAKKAMNVIKKVYGAESVYLCTMCDGPMNHFHIQLIPRYFFEKRGSLNFVKERKSYIEDTDKINKLRDMLKDI